MRDLLRTPLREETLNRCFTCTWLRLGSSSLWLIVVSDFPGLSITADGSR